MKKFLAILIFSLTSPHTAAKWILIQTSDNGSMSIDFESLQKSGDLVTVSTLSDYYGVQQKSELSSQWNELYDCKHKKFKVVAITYFTENMGNGKLIQTTHFNEQETAWVDVVLYSVGELKANIICSK